MLQKTATIYENDKRELQYEVQVMFFFIFSYYLCTNSSIPVFLQLVDLKRRADREKQDKLKLKTVSITINLSKSFVIDSLTFIYNPITLEIVIFSV
jgi:hypothetical protein